MINLFMKSQSCNLIFVTDAQTDGRTEERTDGQAQSSMPHQLFQSWGHKKSTDNKTVCE